MMEHFVTLFNSLFLPQGLALHMSMKRHLNNFTLWMICVDNGAYNALKELNLPNVRLLKLSDFETEELLSVKSKRTIVEYCWTLTPFAPRFVFEADINVKRVTYIDADLWFLKNPEAIYDEFEKSGKQVLITDHAYAPEYDQSSKFGKYCVQFVIFNRIKGESVRKWWEEQCIEWCYSKLESGKFGDQKYLDYFPEYFSSDVHVLCEKEFTLAPWNATRFPHGNAIFYHFHGLRIVSKNKLQIGSYSLPISLKENVYLPYCKDLRSATNRLESINFLWKPQVIKPNVIKRIYYKIKNIGRVISLLVPSNYMRW